MHFKFTLKFDVALEVQVRSGCTATGSGTHCRLARTGTATGSGSSRISGLRPSKSDSEARPGAESRRCRKFGIKLVSYSAQVRPTRMMARFSQGATHWPLAPGGPQQVPVALPKLNLTAIQKHWQCPCIH